MADKKNNKEKNENNPEELKQTSDEFQEIKIQYDTIKKEYDSIKNSLLRLQAEFDNFRKRTESEKSKFVNLASKEVVKKILPIIDNFELALESHEEKSNFYKGIEMIYSQLKEVIDEEGVEIINSMGDFNPNIHEAILVEESEKSHNQVIEILQNGYKLGDYVLRHAKVKITKKKQTPNGGN
ncbi:nucleotide exchange factor GrpE [Candidatus Woesearchaeota archaeon]|nr:nucleotide exchange factor GrpE [Candidatus Woesearchaeota archaeon]MCF8013912.1 nucleotide exchange factor GrpE [Candidatus Woesearchaeota archaeon]